MFLKYSNKTNHFWDLLPEGFLAIYSEILEDTIKTEKYHTIKTSKKFDVCLDNSIG